MKSLRENIERVIRKAVGISLETFSSKAKGVTSMVRKDFQRVGSELVLIITYCRTQSGLNTTYGKLLNFSEPISFLVMEDNNPPSKGFYGE